VDVIVGVGVPNSGSGVLVMTFWVGPGVGVQVGGKTGVLSSMMTGADSSVVCAQAERSKNRNRKVNPFECNRIAILKVGLVHFDG
jgi:hypothetical protein